MKKYRALKDIPTLFGKDEIFIRHDDGQIDKKLITSNNTFIKTFYSDSNLSSLCNFLFENYPELFEPVEEKKWETELPETLTYGDNHKKTINQLITCIQELRTEVEKLREERE